jgi:chaperonin cofactor prefoldin
MIDITNQERDIQNQSAQDQLWKNADRATYQADIQTRNLNTALGRNAENQDMANQNNIDAQNRLNRDYNTELQKVQQEAEFGNSNMSSANASSGVGVTGYTRARGEYMTRVQNQIQNLQTHYGDSVANLQKTIALTNVKYSRAAEDLATQLSDVKNNLSRYLTDIQNTSLDLADRQKAIANLEALKQKYIYLSQNQAILNRAKAEADNALQKRADFLTQQTGTVWTVGDDGMLHDTGSKTLAGQNYDLNVNKAAFDQWYKTQGMAIRRAASSRRISSNTGTPASLYQQIADFAKTGNPTQQDVVNYAAYLAYKFPSKKAGKMVDMQNAVNIGNMVYGDIHQMSVSPLAPERTALNTSTTTSNNPNPPLTPQDLKQL